MEMPNTLRVGPITFDVVECTYPIVHEGVEMWGQTVSSEALINIKASLDPQQQLATLMHELLHIISNQTASEVDEATVERVSNLLLDTIQRNDLDFRT